MVETSKKWKKMVKVGENTNKPYPECERSIKIPVVNNAHSITKYGVLGRLDVQIVVLSAAPKRSGGARVKKDARRANAPPRNMLNASHWNGLTCRFEREGQTQLMVGTDRPNDHQFKRAL